MATTRKTLRQRIGGMDFAADMISSTAMTGSSTTVIVDTKLVNQSDTFVGAQVVVTGGAAIGDYRWVTAYVASTGTITVDRAFTAGVVNTDPYELHRVFSGTDKNDAINAAIREAKLRWPRIVEDESVLMVADQWTYALASLTVPLDAIALLDKVEWDPGLSGTGYPWRKFDDDEYTVRRDDTSGAQTHTLQLLCYPPYAGKAMRLTYRARPAELSADSGASGTLNPDNAGFVEYICAKATAILAEQRANLAGEGDSRREHWGAMWERMSAKAEIVMSQDREPPVPGKVIFPIGDSGSSLGWKPSYPSLR